MVIDLVVTFLMNAAADSLILLLVRRELFPRIPRPRIWKSGCISSITYILWCGLSPFLLRRLHIILAFGIVGVILAITFHIRKISMLLKAAGTVMLHLCTLGGCGMLVQRNTITGRLPLGWQLPLIFLPAAALTILAQKRVTANAEGNLYDVEIRRNAKIICCQGLYDSGNLLVSRMTGSGISVLSFRQAEPLLDDREKVLLQIWEKQGDFSRLAGEKGIYPISFHTVGRREGCMPGILADEITVKKEGRVLAVRKGMLGISAETMSKEERFSVLLPEDIFS
jgi:sigma-E processing peptidase SpoIIGA